LTLLAYIVANAILGVALRADVLGAPRAWPFFGCFLWAVSTAASAWRQLSITDEAEIREGFDNAMSTIRSMNGSVKGLDANVFTQTLHSLTSSRFDPQLPTFNRLAQDRDRARDRYQQQKGRGKDRPRDKEIESSRLLMVGRQSSRDH